MTDHTDQKAQDGKEKPPGPQTRPKPAPDLAGTIGIAALAARTGTGPDQILAVLAHLLCGTAGSGAWLGTRFDGNPLPKFDLLVHAEDPALRRMIERLVAQVRLINRNLSDSLGTIHPDIVSAALYGAMTGGRAAKIASQQLTTAAIERHQSVLESPPKGPGPLQSDGAGYAEARNIEAALHAEFLLENSQCRDLAAALERCHQREALVVFPKLDSSREGSEPVKDLRRLMELMAGTASGQAATPGRAACLPLKAHTLLSAAPADLERMASSVPGMLGHFLWLPGATDGDASAGNEAETLPAATGNTGNTGSVETLMRAFVQALVSILETRREGGMPCVGFESDAAADAYEARMHTYRKWADTLTLDPADGPGPVARELPSMLYWALHTLCRELPAELQPVGPILLDTAFNTAKRLTEAHAQQLRDFLYRDRLAQQMSLALSIVQLVEEKAPLSFRGLYRSFNRQHIARFQPLVDALVRLKVLKHSGRAGALSPGLVGWLDIKDKLREQLAARLQPQTAAAAGETEGGDSPAVEDGGAADGDRDPDNPQDTATPGKTPAGRRDPGPAGS